MVTTVDRAANLRIEYESNGLDEAQADPDPYVQFETWFGQALTADLGEPTAMFLATATKEGKPSVRAVLYKGMFQGGFTFYSNYESRKASELNENPAAAGVFWWQPLHRQVRLEGSVHQLPTDVSDAYFSTRPPGSRLAAAVSPQSRVVPDRKWLEEAYQRLESSHPDGDPRRPDTWGGYVLNPDTFEFWQGRPNRLHDRLRYRRDGETWTRERLAP